VLLEFGLIEKWNPKKKKKKNTKKKEIRPKKIKKPGKD